MSTQLYQGFEQALSHDRFATYLRWAAGDRDTALDLYTLNTRLSESFYTPLAMLEVALRNQIHAVMSAAAGESWFDLPAYQRNRRQKDMLAKARLDLTQAKKTLTPGAIVAALTFGYWTSMLGREYEDLWQSRLHQIARRPDGKGLQRKALAIPLGPIRNLRNRIAHHEPILHWNLRDHHGEIVEITRWLSPVAAQWSSDNSTFDENFPGEGVTLA